MNDDERRYTVGCDECGGYHGDDFSEGDAWDEANAHERATGHTTYVAIKRRAAIRQAKGEE